MRMIGGWKSRVQLSSALIPSSHGHVTRANVPGKRHGLSLRSRCLNNTLYLAYRQISLRLGTRLWTNDSDGWYLA